MLMVALRRIEEPAAGSFVMVWFDSCETVMVADQRLALRHYVAEDA